MLLTSVHNILIAINLDEGFRFHKRYSFGWTELLSRSSEWWFCEGFGLLFFNDYQNSHTFKTITEANIFKNDLKETRVNAQLEQLEVLKFLLFIKIVKVGEPVAAFVRDAGFAYLVHYKANDELEENIHNYQDNRDRLVKLPENYARMHPSCVIQGD